MSSGERQQLTDDLFERAAADPQGPQRDEIWQTIVVLHLPVARSIARRYRNRGIDLDDLEQAACLALVRAVQSFDSEAGFEFLAYAVPSIRGGLRRHFRDFGWMVRPPRSVQELQPRVGRAQLELDRKSGRPLTMKQIARRLDTTVEAVREAASASGCFTPSSLDAAVGDEGAELVERLPAEGDGGFGAVEARASLGPALARLTAHERRLLQMRFVEERTQQDMADVLGLTQSQISRNLSQILNRLRRLLADEDTQLAEAG